jgi:trehalose 6-phosphate synthase
MTRVILVSNRVSDLRRAAQAGGVAVALAHVARTHSALWFGWSGEIKPAEEAGAVQHAGRIVTVPLSPTEHERYYLGYANSVLWPVFHNRLDVAQFEAGFFEQYMGVNRRLAALLKPLLRPDDIVWVHDYHLIPLGVELRRLGVANRIGFYLHISFPPWQTFIAIPEHRELARCLAAYDLVGLQTKSDVSNLIDYLANGVMGSVTPDGRIRVFDRLLSVASFPIGIDVADFARPSRDVALVQGRGMSRIIGVDRLDYTKGLPQKFKAFGRFLETNPQYRRQVVLTQIAPPTREDVEAYLDIRRQLERLAGSINGRFGELEWVPIHYIHRSTPRRRLAAIYRSSRIALVTPLRDGMNLVAKEYVAAQDPEDPGVLILSRFAGAAEELDAALIVNPYDIPATAEVIRTALEMSPEERRERHKAMLGVVATHDIGAWCRSFLAALTRVSAVDSPALLTPTEAISRALEKLRQSSGAPPAAA